MTSGKKKQTIGISGDYKIHMVYPFFGIYIDYCGIATTLAC